MKGRRVSVPGRAYSVVLRGGETDIPVVFWVSAEQDGAVSLLCSGCTGMLYQRPSGSPVLERRQHGYGTQCQNSVPVAVVAKDIPFLRDGCSYDSAARLGDEVQFPYEADDPRIVCSR